MVTDKAQVCRNTMEILVSEELNRQLKLIPPRLAKYLNTHEIAAFALNRLPALYATSERGWRQQCVKGKRDYADQIKHAVRQGVAAVQKDPLRVETPLVPPSNQDAEKALAALRQVLQCEELTWQNLEHKVRESLDHSAQQGLSWQSRLQSATSQHNATQHNAWCTAYYRY